MVHRTDTTVIAIRQLSSKVFGAAYRIEVAVAIADAGGIANLTELARSLNDPPGKGGVQYELKKLREASLLGPPQTMGGKKYLMAVESSFWDMCRSLQEEAIDLVGPPPYG